MNNPRNFEVEDDIFSGSPKSKFLEVVKHASEGVVSEELDKIIEKFAALEMILSSNKDADFEINKELENFILKNLDEVSKTKNDLYLEFTANIISKLDS